LHIQELSIERLLYRTILVVWIISAAISFFLLSRIDSIVNGDLYNYGLQLSGDWILPYWAYIRLIFSLLGFSIVISVIALCVGLIRKKEKGTEQLFNKQQSIHQKKRLNNTGSDKTNKIPNKNKTPNTMLISCSVCKKEFGRPMISLSFAQGKARLVSVCPFCEHILDTKEDE
jgi:hypothetical protein